MRLLVAGRAALATARASRALFHMADEAADEVPGGGSGMVKIISAENHTFFVDRETACVSGTIKAMLSGQFAESRGECRFPEITSSILEVCDQLIAVPRSSLPCPPACHACR